MTDVAAMQPAHEAVLPPPISLRELAPWALFGAALLGLLFVVGLDQGSTLHEYLHDGRHLLAFPCH
ncbi:MAG: CbtB-domain containing protein [Thermoleophilaceae bacterium]